jgi:multidrug resistance protein MdtO
MVAASTLVMIIGMTFKIPYAAYAAIFALTISRESVEGTARAARGFVVGSAAGGAYVLLTMALVVGNEMMRFFWVGATLFLAFYGISTLNNYTESARFAYLNVIIIPLVTSRLSTESKVEGTLWAVGSITLGSVITLLMEMAFAAFRRTDDLITALAERLEAAENVLACYLDGRPVDDAAQSAITRLASVGSSRLRRMLQRAGYEPHREQEMGAIVGLVGRLVDLVANLPQIGAVVGEEERPRLVIVAQNIAEIRSALESGRVPRITKPPDAREAPSSLPLLGELEKTVSLIQEVFTGSQSPTAFPSAPAEDRARATVFAPGAFSNPEHVKFALRGCLAASLCYVIYNALDWPGISTSVTTCLLTALTTIGASHQKQLLRFSGALTGGLVVGMGAQVFILPYFDSIAAFTVLFAIVAAIAAWFATASSRLSYFGVQIAVAFNLINLQEFKFQTSLSVARDRVVGIFLGLAMMWLAFDLLWGSPAVVAMRKEFVSTIRLLAQLAREPVSTDRRTAIERSYALRESLNSQFDKVRSLADGVVFEFGPTRQRDLAFRDRIREWQPQLRTLFIMRVTSLKYRLKLPGFELPEEIQLFQQEYDDRSARMLEDMAELVEDKHSVQPTDGNISIPSLENLQRSSPPNLQSFFALLRRIDALTIELASEIGSGDGLNRLV